MLCKDFFRGRYCTPRGDSALLRVLNGRFRTRAGLNTKLLLDIPLPKEKNSPKIILVLMVYPTSPWLWVKHQKYQIL